MTKTLAPHVVMPENASLIKKWLAERGGIAVWESIDMSDLGASWTTPAHDADGKPTTKPHWKSGNQPARIITDQAEVVVEVPRELETFRVTVRVSGNGLMLKLTDGSQRKLEKKMAKHEAANPGRSVWYLRGDMLEPTMTILVADKTIPLAECP